MLQETSLLHLSLRHGKCVTIGVPGGTAARRTEQRAVESSQPCPIPAATCDRHTWLGSGAQLMEHDMKNKALCSPQLEMFPHNKLHKAPMYNVKHASWGSHKEAIYWRAETAVLQEADMQIFEGTLHWPPTIVKRHLPALLIGTLSVRVILPGLAKNFQVQVYLYGLHAIL